MLGLRPDFAAMQGLQLGVIGPHSEDDRARVGADHEVRAFCPELSVPEDPVTGSLNAGLAQWLVPAGVLPERYVAAQGTVIGREGRVHVTVEDGVTWVGGATRIDTSAPSRRATVARHRCIRLANA